MKANRFLLFIFFVATSAFSATWEIDSAHSAARFKIRHMMISNVSGEITGMKGSVQVDDKDKTKMSADVTLDAATINTANEKRDAHLRTADFFEVEKYPTIQFKSKKSTKGDGGKTRLTGDLTLHGATKEVTFDNVEITDAIKDPYGNQRRGLTGNTKLNRKDYNLKWNKTLDSGGAVLGEDVEVILEVEITSPAPKDKKG